MPIPPPPNAKELYTSAFIKLHEWQQPMFNGALETFSCITRPDHVAVLGFLNQDTILLTHQIQPHRPDGFYTLPGGVVDPGESAEQAAKREFEEETGYCIGSVIEWYRFPHKGLSRYEEWLFVAKNLSPLTTGLRPDAAGEKINVLNIPWQEAVLMCLRREWRGPLSMLSVLGMEYEPEQRRQLHEFLSSNT